MATFRFSNLTAERQYMFDFYGFELAPSEVNVDLDDRDPAEVSGLVDTQAKIAAGTISMVVINSTDEDTSGLAQPPNSITGDDIQPVAADANLAAVSEFYKKFVDGTTTGADDVVIFGDAAVPFRLRILDVIWFVETTQASTLELQDAEGGGGNVISAVSGGTAGRLTDDAITNDTTTVLTSSEGLVVRRGHDGIEGEVLIRFRREQTP